jgi:hypothetical protein
MYEIIQSPNTYSEKTKRAPRRDVGRMDFEQRMKQPILSTGDEWPEVWEVNHERQSSGK